MGSPAVTIRRRLLQRIQAIQMRLLSAQAPKQILARTITRPTASFLNSGQMRPYIKFSIKKRKFRAYELKLLWRFAVGWLAFAFIGVPAASLALYQYQVDRVVPVPKEFSKALAGCRKDLMTILEPGAIQTRTEANEGYQWIMKAIDMMESYEYDGEGIQSQPEVVRKWGIPSSGLDVSMKSEEWRREYHLLLINAAKCAEFIPDNDFNFKYQTYVRRSLMTTPENPKPNTPYKFLPEDTVPSLINPEMIYRKVITTKGFSDAQKLEAMVLCATFLDFSGKHTEAEAMFQEAFAVVSKPFKIPPFNRKTLILNEEAGPPSRNLLEVLTQYLTLKAQKNRLEVALPAMLSILRARRSLPEYPPESLEPASIKPTNYWEQLKANLELPEYPPPPPDGFETPWRSPEERCEEAKLSILIGEMLFAGTHKEDGIVWTREGIDTAEEELDALWRIDEATPDVRSATAACRQCLFVGFHNWSKMTEVMLETQKEQDAKDWEEIKELRAKLTRGEIPWWKRWWQGINEEIVKKKYDEVRKGKSDRWMVERRVAFAKQNDDRRFMENLRKPPVGWMAFFQSF